MSNTKFCNKCKCEKDISLFYCRKTENRHHSWCKECFYGSQKQRWHDRKKKAVELLGGKCCVCGYNKIHAALDFHHIDPSTKSYDWQRLKLRCWKDIINELKKCVILCKNCHAEHHWREHENMFCDNNRLNYKIKATGKCKICDEDVYGTIYCSHECSACGNRKVSRPNAEELKEMIEQKSYCAIARQYGVSDNAVRKWARAYKII